MTILTILLTLVLLGISALLFVSFDAAKRANDSAHTALQSLDSARREIIEMQQLANANLRTENSDNFSALRTEISSLLAHQSGDSEMRLEAIRSTLQERVDAMIRDNASQMEKMRAVVEEKMQDTLNRRISESFRTVASQLMKVSEGLGDMQRLAGDVGDLRNVMKNVKTKGILGEYQLSSIITEILAPGQYAANVATRPNSRERVEFAVKLPGEGEAPVWLPVDAKFPTAPYEGLVAARQAGDAQAAQNALKALAASLNRSARDIHDKYIEVPYTTDFAILFLPFESLYAEAVSMGLLAELHQRYKVTIAGPSTLAALLNSLQMGFRTLAIQQRSSEVWEVLSGVKEEFKNFESVLVAAQKRIVQANTDLDMLIGTRSRAISRKLEAVSMDALPVAREKSPSLP